MNDYESAAEARLGSGKDPALFARGRDNFNSYHMSTLGRSSSGRAPPGLIKEPVSSYNLMSGLADLCCDQIFFRVVSKTRAEWKPEPAFQPVASSESKRTKSLLLS